MMWIDHATQFVTDAMIRADLPAAVALLLGAVMGAALWVTTRRKKADQGLRGRAPGRACTPRST